MKLKKILAITTIVGLALYKLNEKSNKNEGNNQDKYVLVTGASTGIGRAIVESLAENGYNVFATVRKDSDYEELSQISNNIIPIRMDVTDSDSILATKETIKRHLNGKSLYSLINNAGIAVVGPLELLSIDDLRKQFEVNYFGVFNTTQIFFDLLDKNGSKILNMSSVGGKIATPFMGPYNSSKFALEAMSDSLRRELLNTNIEVIVVEPGMIVTPIWDKAEEMDIEKYKDTLYVSRLEKMKNTTIQRGKNAAPVEKVSDRILAILSRKSNKSRYWVSGTPLSEVFIPRILPDKALDFVFSKLL